MKAKVSDSVTLCFNIQLLLKSLIQEAYYSRQVGLYCLCIVRIDRKNPSFCLWTEYQAGEGSIEVSSAVLQISRALNYFKILHISDYFVTDAQNKNNFVLHT